MINRKDLFKNVKKIVIKIGTSLITTSNCIFNEKYLENISSQITKIISSEKEVILVTSGAVGSGLLKLNIKHKPKNIPVIQAIAAVGQTQLMNIYEKFFKEQGLIVGQVLLTSEDFTNRTRYLNAMNTIFSLLKLKVIPIINENDAVAIDEIKFGDNDNLSAQVANLIEADLLVILTDVDGLYDNNPHKSKNVQIIKEVKKIDDEIKSFAGGSHSLTGKGGMITKLQAAKIVTESGIAMIIANGQEENIILKILSGEKKGTLFLPKEDKLTSRKKWIAFTLPSQGKLLIDKGAEKAIKNEGKSLLSSGIIDIQGTFFIGEKVDIADSFGKSFGCGIVNYN
ncbi:MAG: glutamate 5-kinase, partial [bacterium]